MQYRAADEDNIWVSWPNIICLPTDLVLIHPQTLSDPIQTPSRHPETQARQPETQSRHPQKAFLCNTGNLPYIIYIVPFRLYYIKMPMSEGVWMGSGGVWMVSQGVWDVWIPNPFVKYYKSSWNSDIALSSCALYCIKFLQQVVSGLCLGVSGWCLECVWGPRRSQDVAIPIFIGKILIRPYSDIALSSSTLYCKNVYVWGCLDGVWGLLDNV